MGTEKNEKREQTDVYKIMKTVGSILPLVDLGMTHRGIDMNRAVEANPLARPWVHSPLSVPLVGGLSVATNLYTDGAWNSDKEWLAYGLQALRILFSSVAIINNLKYMRDK